MSCYATITASTKVYVYYDTSGSLPVSTLQDTVDDLIALLEEEHGVPPGNVTETSNSNERWVQHTGHADDDFVVIIFTNEADDEYHTTTDDGPTSEFLADYDNAKGDLQAATRARVLVYGIDTNSGATMQAFFDEHLPRAVNGSHGYPNNPSLGDLGVTYRTYVPKDRTASQYLADLEAYLTEWIGGGFCEPARWSYREDAGSILDNVEAQPSEVSARMAFDSAVQLRAGQLHPFPHPLDPSAVPFRAYPHAVPNAEYLSTYVFETKIGRMARTFPSMVHERVDKIDDAAIQAALVDGEKVSAQAALDYLFRRWDGEFDWFTFEPVPDLRTWRADNDYSGTNGVPYVRAIRVRQAQGRRKSMLTILREWLSPFNVTPRQNSSGNVILVPQHGPDADANPTKTLTSEDIVWPALTKGGNDERFAKNRVRITNRGDTRQEDVQVMQPAWLQVCSSLNFGWPDVLFSPPVDQLNLSPGEDEDGEVDDAVAVQADLDPSDAFNAQGLRWFWPVGEDAIPAGEDGILLTDSSDTKQITVEFVTSDKNGNVKGNGTVPASDITVNAVPYTGASVEALRVEHGGARIVLAGRWIENGDQKGIQLSLTDAHLETTTVFGSASGQWWTFGVNLQDASVAITEGESKTVTVGVEEPDGTFDETLPGADGGNAIAESQAANGVNEATLDITVYEFEPGELVDIGLSFLATNINPRRVRSGQQSPWSAWKIDTDDIGHLVELGDGAQAIVTGVGVTVDFTPGHDPPVLTSDVQFVVVDDPVLDEDTDYLLFADGSYFILADGSISEAA